MFVKLYCSHWFNITPNFRKKPFLIEFSTLSFRSFKFCVACVQNDWLISNKYRCYNLVVATQRKPSQLQKPRMTQASGVSPEATARRPKVMVAVRSERVTTAETGRRRSMAVVAKTNKAPGVEPGAG